jgi:hypothetical protein
LLIAVATVEAKLASSFIAAEISLSVFKRSGAESTSPVIAESV